GFSCPSGRERPGGCGYFFYRFSPGGSLPALRWLWTFRPRAIVWLCCGRLPPALTFVLTLRPRAIVWLWLSVRAPAFTSVFTFSPRDTVWLWLELTAPALTFDLIFILLLLFKTVV